MQVIYLIYGLYLLASPVILLLFYMEYLSGNMAVWVIGLFLGIIRILRILLKTDMVQQYSAKQFEQQWIIDRKKGKGLKYRDHPGCYVLFVYRYPKLLPIRAGYTSVYVGQSMTVYSRVHNHLNRKGNGDVYADLRNGRNILVDIYDCKPEKLNEMECRLIEKYHAEKYYNRTAGGARKR